MNVRLRLDGGKVSWGITELIPCDEFSFQVNFRDDEIMVRPDGPLGVGSEVLLEIADIPGQECE